jgi:hypothetical protein
MRTGSHQSVLHNRSAGLVFWLVLSVVGSPWRRRFVENPIGISPRSERAAGLLIANFLLSIVNVEIGQQ